MQVVEEYRQALPVYENFYQKRAAQKLRKLLADRAALPIASFEATIIGALRSNPAIVVAGDTGATQHLTLKLDAGVHKRAFILTHSFWHLEMVLAQRLCRNPCACASQQVCGASGNMLQRQLIVLSPCFGQ